MNERIRVERRTWHGPGLLSSHTAAVVASAVLYLVAAGMFVAMATGPGSRFFQRIDDWWFETMVAAEVGWLVSITNPLDLIGGAWVTAPVRIGVAGWLAHRRRWVAFGSFVSAVLLVDVAVGILKPLYGRARPPMALVETTNAAFPSGHASATAVTAIAVVIVLIRAGPHRREWEILAGTIAFFMALSRTYLRAHWLTDVVAGTLLGVATAIGIAAAFQAWRVHWYVERRHRLPPPEEPPPIP